MAEVLLFTPDDSSRPRLSELAAAAGVKLRAARDVKSALELIRNRRFEAVLVHFKTSFEEQQALAGELWSVNPSGAFVIFDLENQLRLSSQEARLFGADVFRGKEAEAGLQEFFGKLGREAIRGADFKIMVVEDVDSARDIICFYIETLGFPKVVGMRSAIDALAELIKKPGEYSCVITDMRMPEKTGAELVSELRQMREFKSLPIIMLTAHGTADILVECLKAGASGFLVKPPKKADLMRELARSMRIAAGLSSPRLSSPEEAEQLKSILIDKGLS